MAKIDKTTMNVRQKLAKARLDFLDAKVQKSGKHMQLEFKYFELDDIVPAAIRIFFENGLVSNTVFDDVDRKATMTIYDADDMNSEGIVFSAPFRETEQIISKAGKMVTNPVQALGSSITYLRRYLWMMALDITEPDSIDPNTQVEEESVPVRKIPATVEERAEAKITLTSSDPNADEELIGKLKSLCKQLLEKDETQEEFVTTIALKTEGFTTISSSACNSLCENLEMMLNEYGE